MSTLPKITSAMLVVTHACNLRCRYCFVHQEPSYMSFENAMAATHFLIENAEKSGNIPNINFFGGEPLLMWDSIICPLTTWIRQEYKNPFSLSMTTNGSLLNEDKLRFMKDNEIGILLSIDGDKETQDYNRPLHGGGSSFDAVLSNLPLVLKYFPNTTFRMTTIPQTCNRLFENIMFASSYGFKQFFVMPNMFEVWDTEHRRLLASEMRKYSDYYINAYRIGKRPCAFPEFEKSFLDIKKINFAIVNNEYRTFNSCKSCGKCGLGGSRFASVHPNGNIYACQEMTSNDGEDSIFYIGNIFSGVDNSRRKALMDLYDQAPAIGSGCSTCLVNRICDGGCVANNYMITGSVNKLPDVYCWWKRLLLDEAIYIMQTLGNEENEAFRERWRNIR